MKRAEVRVAGKPVRELPGVSLAKARRDMGADSIALAPARKGLVNVGWIAALDSSGRVVAAVTPAAIPLIENRAGCTFARVMASAKPRKVAPAVQAPAPATPALDNAIRFLGGNPDEAIKPYDVLQVQRDGRWLDFSTIREGDLTAVWGILRRGFDGASRWIPAGEFRVIRPGFNPERIVAEGGK